MGSLEAAGKKRKRKRDIGGAILTAVELAAIAGLALVPSNLPRVLKTFHLLPTESHDASTIARARRKLLTRGHLTAEKGRLRLTRSGQTALWRLESANRRPKERR